MKKYSLVLILIVAFNCNKNTSDENFTDFESYISEGETKTASYTFCGFIPKEVEYTYRVGLWTFKSSKGHKIAEGEYDIESEQVGDSGGCSYNVMKNSVNLEKWEFWNEVEEIIEPTKKIINLIHLYQTNSESPFIQNQ